MTNIKRGSSQVAKNTKRGNESGKSQTSKKKSQSAQKAPLKVNESLENRPKKAPAQKAKKPKTSAIHSSVSIKKKDIDQHKNKIGSGTSKLKIKREVSKKEPTKRSAHDIVLKSSVRSTSTVRSKDAKSNKSAKNVYVKEKTRDDNTRRPKAGTERLSKDKLEEYLAYITAKLSKGRYQDPNHKGRHKNCFKPPDLFGTIKYKKKVLEQESFQSYVSSKSAPAAKKKIVPPKPVEKKAAIPRPAEKNANLGQVIVPKAAPKAIVPKPLVKQPPVQPVAAAPTPIPSIPAPETTPPDEVPLMLPKPYLPTSKHSTVSLKSKSLTPNPAPVTPTPISVNVVPIPMNIVSLPKSSNPAPKPAGGDNVHSAKSAKPHTVSLREEILSNSPQESTSGKYKQMKFQTGEELLKFYKNRVERAIKDRKTFTVCGNFWSVRKALTARGWVEKIHYSYAQSDRDEVKRLATLSLNELIERVSDRNNGTLYKRVIMSKMLGKHQVDLFWDFGCDPYKSNPDNVKLTLINNIRRGLCSYSTKEGLCEIMKKSHWYQFPGVSNIRHPRSYTLTDNGDPEEFIKDFRLTAAIAMLKWIVVASGNSQGKVISDGGKVSIKNFHFALSECEKFLRVVKHEDIDGSVAASPEYEWNSFLENYYRCVHVGNHFKSSDGETEHTIVQKSKTLLAKLRKTWPSMDMDGYMNIWILKPTAGSRGIGIHICRTLSYVLRVVSERKTIKYVIQKYIERPLLIYNTKFDIRQWFLISCTNPLTIWIYKLCYLRFSSQTYNLRKLHESIHLTNNSVQCKYKNMNRDPELPEYNMWDSNRFRSYLEAKGFPHAYDNIVYPGMKQCITAAVLVHQEFINTRKNCFELYGADFMLTEDFQPWLLEINSRPALYASTPITGRMCPQALEDVIKVIVDYGRNPKANTGSFELMYHEVKQNLPPIDVSTLAIRGVPLAADYFLSPATSIAAGAAGNRPKAKVSSFEFLNIHNAQHYIMYASKQLTQTLRTLLDLIDKERERRRNSRRPLLKSTSTSARPPESIGTTSTTENSTRNHLVSSVHMPYITATRGKKNLKEIQEIYASKHHSNKKLNKFANNLRKKNKCDLLEITSEASSDDSIKHTVNYTETEFNYNVNTTDKSEMTSNDQNDASVSYKLSKEDSKAIKDSNELLKQRDNQVVTSGFLAELFNYFGFWRVFTKSKFVVSAPVSSKNSKSESKTNMEK